MKLVKCFLKAMIKWAKAGFPVVEYYAYWRRRMICRECSNGWSRCPICGCFLAGYCRLGTSKCRNWNIDKPDKGYEPTEKND